MTQKALSDLLTPGFPSLVQRSHKQDPFKFSLLGKQPQKLYDKVESYFEDQDLEIVFEEVENIYCIDSFFDIDDTIDTDQYNIIIITDNQFGNTDEYYNESTIDMLPTTINIGQSVYEMRCFVEMNNLDNEFSDDWDGTVYSCHGGRFSKWWKQKRTDILCRQRPNLPPTKQSNEFNRFIFVYVKAQIVNCEKLNFEYLKYLVKEI